MRTLEGVYGVELRALEGPELLELEGQSVFQRPVGQPGDFAARLGWSRSASAHPLECGPHHGYLHGGHRSH